MFSHLTLCVRKTHPDHYPEGKFKGGLVFNPKVPYTSLYSHPYYLLQLLKYCLSASPTWQWWPLHLYVLCPFTSRSPSFPLPKLCLPFPHLREWCCCSPSCSNCLISHKTNNFLHGLQVLMFYPPKFILLKRQRQLPKKKKHTKPELTKSSYYLKPLRHLLPLGWSETSQLGWLGPPTIGLCLPRSAGAEPLCPQPCLRRP